MNSHPDAPMDTQLLQLERELFSLTPVETSRHLALRLDRLALGPVAVGRQVAVPAKIIPFHWRRIVVPAAAAVVVVSVLNYLDQPAISASGEAQSNRSSPTSDATFRPAPVSLNNGYVLRAEPILLGPGNWQGMEQRYIIQPGNGRPEGYNTPQRTSGIVPVVFH